MNVALTKHALKSLDQRVRERCPECFMLDGVHEMGCAEDEWIDTALATGRIVWWAKRIGLIALLVILGVVLKTVV